MNVETDTTGAFERLTFLLSQVPCPPESFGNLLLLYIKFEYYDIAADLLAENGPMYSSTLSPVGGIYLDLNAIVSIGFL